MPQSSPQLATLSSPFLGLGVISSTIGLQTLFSDGLSLVYNFGAAVGQLVGTAVLALPI